MKVALYALWLAGVALLVSLIAYYGAGDLLTAIGVAGWGIAWVVAYRLVPMLPDTLGWLELLPRPRALRRAPGASPDQGREQAIKIAGARKGLRAGTEARRPPGRGIPADGSPRPKVPRKLLPNGA